MTWNYRIVRRMNPTTDPPTPWYGIHEVYYDDAGVCTMLTTDETGIVGDTTDELQECWARMVEAFAQPVIDYDTRQEVAPAPVARPDATV